jgi:hypothetical protein
MLFAVMMVIQLIFVWKVMPETKGKSLDQEVGRNEIESEKLLIQ